MERGKGSSAAGRNDKNGGVAQDAPALIAASDVAQGSSGPQDSSSSSSENQDDAYVHDADVDEADVDDTDDDDAVPAAGTSKTRRVTRSMAKANIGGGSSYEKRRITRSMAAAGTNGESVSEKRRATQSMAAESASTSQRISKTVTPKPIKNAASPIKGQQSSPVTARRRPLVRTRSDGTPVWGSQSSPVPGRVVIRSAADERRTSAQTRGAKRKGNAKSEGSNIAPEGAVAERVTSAKKEGKGKIGAVETKNYMKPIGRPRRKVSDSDTSPDMAVAESKKGNNGKEKAKVEGSPADARPTIVIEHFVRKPSIGLRDEAEDFRRRLQNDIPNAKILINPWEEKESFVIRQHGGNGETFLQLLDMRRPCKELKNLDKDAKVKEIAERLKNNE